MPPERKAKQTFFAVGDEGDALLAILEYSFWVGFKKTLLSKLIFFFLPKIIPQRDRSKRIFMYSYEIYELQRR